MIQDIEPHILNNSYDPNKKPQADSLIFSFRKRSVLVTEDFTFPTYAQMPAEAEYVYLFSLDDRDCFLIKHHVRLEGYYYEDVWNLRNDDEDFAPYLLDVVTAYSLSNWYRHNRYCGYCGVETTLADDERAIVCPHCGNRIYPRLNPAVIVGVMHGDEILITKYAQGYGHNALIAGFVEIGETLEQTVAREVMEEVGLKVKNIRYYKSQPWGFVDDILMGFYCVVDGDTKIKLDTSELKKGVWTKREDIHLQPDHLSLTNEMMEMFQKGLIDESYCD